MGNEPNEADESPTVTGSESLLHRITSTTRHEWDPELIPDQLAQAVVASLLGDNPPEADQILDILRPEPSEGDPTSDED